MMQNSIYRAHIIWTSRIWLLWGTFDLELDGAGRNVDVTKK